MLSARLILLVLCPLVAGCDADGKFDARPETLAVSVGGGVTHDRESRFGGPRNYGYSAAVTAVFRVKPTPTVRVESKQQETPP